MLLVATCISTLAGGCSGHITELAQQLADEDAHVRRQAARTLGELGSEAKAAVPALSKALHDNDADVRRLVAYALGQIGTDASSALEDLKKTLTDRDQRVGLTVAYAIGSIDNRNPAVIPLLSAAARTGDVRAIIALGRMGSAAQPAVPILIQALRERRYSLIRLKAAEALAEIGMSAQAAVGALREATQDRDTNVRQAAQRALEAIGGSEEAS